MLTEKEVLERAFEALDELVGQQEPRAVPRRILAEATGDETPEIGVGPDAEVAHSNTLTATTGKDPKTPPGRSEPESVASRLKGHVIELWCDHAGGRVFIVADQEDALEAVRRLGVRRGEIWTGPEVELVARIEDQSLRDEIAMFKRNLDGTLSPEAAGDGVSPEEWKAAMLNRFCQEQGVTGQPGRITAETVRHGERRNGGRRS